MLNIFYLCLLSLSLITTPVFAEGVTPWTNLGIYGGEICDIAIDPCNPLKMFAGGHLGDGLFVSEDGGEHWRGVLTGKEGINPEASFRNTVVFAIDIAPPPYNNIIWVAHDKYVKKSIDGGMSWIHFTNESMQRDCTNCGGETDDGRVCMSIAINPNNPQIVYVGTGGPDGAYSPGAVYKTEDGGETWKKLIINPSPHYDEIFSVVDLEIHPDAPDIIWAITDASGSHPKYGVFGSIFRSGDGGDNWLWIYSFNGFFDIEIKPDNPNVIFVASLGIIGMGGIFKFYYDTNSGKWENLPIAPESINVRALAFDPKDPDIIYATWRNPENGNIPKVARSINGGIDWETYDFDYQLLTLTVHPSNSAIIFGGGFVHGVYKSEDYGKGWIPINNGINAIQIYDLDVDPNNRGHILAATSKGVFEKKIDGEWLLISKFDYPPTYSIAFHPTNPGVYYAGIEGAITKTLDGGINWSYSNPLAASGDTSNLVSDIAIHSHYTDPEETVIFASVFHFIGNYGEIYKSVDGGNEFTRCLEGENNNGEKYGFNTVSVDPADPNHIFAGGGNFSGPEVNGDLWESTDCGNNWMRTALNDVIVNTILINPLDPNMIYAGCGFSEGTDIPLYISKDGGRRFIPSYNGIPEKGPQILNSVVDLTFHYQNRDIVYAATLKEGIYVSINKGENWIKLGSPEYIVFAIAASSLYAGTESGLWQCTGTGVIAGTVTDPLTLLPVDNATIFNDIGIKTISTNGEFILVPPAGRYDVTAIADDYASITVKDISVYGGDVTWIHFLMSSGESSACYSSDIPGRAGTKGNMCFISSLF